MSPCLETDSQKAPDAFPADWKVQVVTRTIAINIIPSCWKRSIETPAGTISG